MQKTAKPARIADSPMRHAAMPCPVCNEAVAVVADLDNSRSRWCCTSCLTIGSVPWIIANSPADSVRPFAQA